MKIERILIKERTRIQEALTAFNERLAKLDKAAAILNGSGHHVRHKHMSAETKLKMSKAQKARYAKLR